MKRKNLKRALALGLVLASTSLLGVDTDIFRSTAYAASHGTVDVDGYSTADIKKAAEAAGTTGVMFDGGWYAPDGKFYTFVQTDGTIDTNNLLSYDRQYAGGPAKGLSTEQTNKLYSMGLDHLSQADAIWDHDAIPSYTGYMSTNGFNANSVAKLLGDNLKFNSDLNRTLVESEEADRKATDNFLNTKIDTIDVVQTGNGFTFTDGDGKTKTLTFTDTNTNDTLVASNTGLGLTNDGKLTLTVTDTSGKKVTGSADIGTYVTNNAGDATVTIGGTSTTIEQAINNNYNSISTNTTEITNIKNNYVTNITEGGIDENGDIINRNEHFWTVNQIIDGVETPVTVKDLNTTNDKLENVWGNSDDITITLTDTDGKFVQTTLSNIAKASDVDNLTDVIGAGTTEQITNKYGDTNYITNETTLIDADIKLDQEIKNINNNNVTNITKNDNNSWTVTQTVNGESTPVTITDTITTVALGTNSSSSNLALDGGTINPNDNTIKYTLSLKDDVTFNSVTANTISAGIVNADDVNANTVDANTVNAGTVNAGIVNAGAVNADTITAGTVDATEVNTQTINANTGNFITVNSDVVNGNTGNFNTINAAVTNSGTVNADKVNANVITADKVQGSEAGFTTVNAGTVNSTTVNGDTANFNTVNAGAVNAGQVGTQTIYLGTPTDFTTIKYENGSDRITYDDNVIATLDDGMSYGADKGALNTLKLNDTLTINGDKNITTISSGNDQIAVTLNDDISVNSVTSNTVNATTVNSTTVNTETINVGDNITIQEGNVDMGGNKITNVYEGDLYQGSMDAVNGGQLWQTNQRLDSLGNRVDKVGAGAAALAALHPLDFDPDDKLSFSAGVGNYAGATASAIGAFYRPDERTMFSIGGTVGNGENMVNAGVSFALGRGGHVTKSRVAMAHEINDLRAQVAELTAMVSQLAAIHSNFKFDSMRPFPDTPENHWAYEYIGKLAAEGIVEGYPDGNFSGERSMTRYEFGAMLYRALQKGFAIDERLIDEFEPELGRLSVERIKGELNQKNKIERVRINDKGEDRDVYGGKITVGKTW